MLSKAGFLYYDLYLVGIFFHRQTLTRCPGTQFYMPPESLSANPSYDCKLDVFSFGVLLLAIATSRAPHPDDTHYLVGADGRRHSIPEVERRWSDLQALPQTHPFRPLILACLCDNPEDRPSAVELHQRTLLLNNQYSSSDQV